MFEPIAIIGISVELPSGSFSERNLDHSTFFDFLLDKGQAYEKIPSDRFNIDAWKGTALGRISAERGAFLKGIDLFDNIEFGVSQKDALTMSPSTRKLLEHSFLALRDSGIDFRGRQVGCFATAVDHDLAYISDAAEFASRGSFANSPTMVANKISYHLDLRGPSIPSNTACSASCTCLHLAVTSLMHGDCEAAVVASSQLNYSFIEWFHYSRGGVLSRDGKCKPFDASADGFSRGEGIVAVVLKPLSKALADGDHIYGNVLGTAVNSCGSVAPPNVPVAESQRLAMSLAFDRAKRSPREVDYVECHATGTAKGDPIELNWIGESFSRDGDLIVGSVKANIGHTEVTSFLASLSKVLSMFQYQTIPPSVNLKTLNPLIRWDQHRLVVPSRAVELPSRASKTLVAIASSGIGGANAHIVLESPSPPTRKSNFKSDIILVAVGGLTSRSTTALCETYAKFMQDNLCDAHDLAAVSGRQTRQTTWRTFAVVKKEQVDSISFPRPVNVPSKRPQVVLVFSGQGPQFLDMGRQLFAHHRAFRDSILESDAIYKNKTGQSVIDDFGLFDCSKVADPSRGWPMKVTLPALLFFQIAVYDLLLSIGVTPDALVGHSAGETAVLYACGAGSRALAIGIAIARAEAMTPLESLGGGMAALSCSRAEVRDLLREVNEAHPHDSPMEIACHNSPNATAVAGPDWKIEHLLRLAQARKVTAKRILTKVPGHSSLMESCHSLYSSLIADVFDSEPSSLVPQTLTYSTLTGKRMTDPFNATYFWDNTRYPVLFEEAISLIHQQLDNPIFIEVSCHPVLTMCISDIINEPGKAFGCASRPSKRSTSLTEDSTFLNLCGSLLIAGYNAIDTAKLHDVDLGHARRPLPPYPFNRKSFPILPEGQSAQRQFEPHFGPLNHKYLRINQETHPSLAQHVVRGEAIMPASGFIEMALEFGANALVEINFRSVLPLTSEKPVRVAVLLNDSQWTVTSHNTKEVLHADGFLSFDPTTCTTPVLDLNAVKERCEPMDMVSFYASLSDTFNYGPVYQRVTEVYYGSDEYLARIDAHDDFLEDNDYLLQPAMLDACFQPAAFHAFHGDFDPNAYFLPSRIGRVLIHRPLCKQYPASSIFAHCTLLRWTPNSIAYNISVFTIQGEPLCSLEDFEVTRHQLVQLSPASRHFDFILQSIGHVGSSHAVELPQLEPDPEELDHVQHIHTLLRQRILPIMDKHRVVKVLVIDNEGLDVSESFGEFGCLHPFVIHTTVEKINSDPVVNHLYNVVLHFSATYSDPSTSIIGLVVPGGHYLFSFDDTKDFSMQVAPHGLRTLSCTSIPKTNTTHQLIHFERDLCDHDLVLFNDSSLLFIYTSGEEISLQKTLCGLDMFQTTDLWIAAACGQSFAEARGLSRVLRREYPGCRIRLVGLPVPVTETELRHLLRSLHPYLGVEDEIQVLEDGQIVAPWMVAIQPVDVKPLASLNKPYEVNLALVSSSVDPAFPDFFAFAAKHNAEESPFLGISSQSVAEHLTLDSRSLWRAPEHVGLNIVSAIPALLTVVLGLSINMFTHSERLRTFHVLLTHADSQLGQIASQLCKTLQVDLVETNETTIIGFSRFKHGSFDVILSGHTDRGMQAALKLLLTPVTGSLFCWADSAHGLVSIARKSPWLIQDALEVGFQYLDDRHISFNQIVPGSTEFVSRSATLFSPHNTYILLGGIGSIGPHIALWMYERGARHIILTSRTGEATLLQPTNKLPRRIIGYLRGKQDLHLRLVSSDASSSAALRSLVEGLPHPVGGCFLLTAANADRMFASLTPEDFSRVRRASIEALDTILQVLDVPSLEFLVAFSSPTPVFGNGGQANYSLAKSVADEKIRGYSNAFSFVCPPVTGTTLLAGIQVAPGQTSWSGWQMSVQDVLISLEDGLRQLQAGADIGYYIPDFSWPDVERTIGSCRFYDYLLPPKDRKVLKTTSIDSQQLLTDIVRRHLDLEEDELDAETLLVSYGLDSLSASNLAFALKKELGIQVSQIQLLANVSLQSLWSQLNTPPSDQLDNSGFEAAVQEMQHLIAKYSFPLIPREAVATAVPDANRVVLITGTTGSLGSYVLQYLLNSSTVDKVFALNRAHPHTDMQQRQHAAFLKAGIDVEICRSPKLVLLSHDLTSENIAFLLTNDETLTSTVTDIIHCAWSSDFASSLQSSEGLIRGTHALSLLALKSKHLSPPRIMFISSIAVCQFIKNENGASEEIVDMNTLQHLEETQLSDMSGYVQSKLVAEIILNRAAQQQGLPVSIVRVGQLSAGLNETWNLAHWVPALIKSSLLVNCLPTHRSLVSWIPADMAAKIITEEIDDAEGILHLVHPNPIKWDHIAEVVAKRLRVPLVPYDNWFRRIETEELSEENPASRLLDFYRQGLRENKLRGAMDSLGLLAKVKMERRWGHSQTFAELPALNARDVERWIDRWEDIGFLQPQAIV